MPFARPSTERHNTVGSATAQPTQPSSSRSERGALERLSLKRVHADGQTAQRRGDTLGSIPNRERRRAGPYPREQPALLDRGDPAGQRRPAIVLEAESPGANSQPCLAL